MARNAAGGAGRTRYGVVLAGVAVVGVAAGALIAGLPTEVADDIRASDIRGRPTASTERAATTTDRTADTQDTTRSPDATELGRSPTGSSAARPSTTIRAIAPSTSVTSTVATAVDASTTTTVAPRPVDEVSVVVANGGGANGLAGGLRDDLREQGYAAVSATNATRRFATSIVYFAAGFQPEAARLAAQVGIATVEAAPRAPITENGSTADVVIVLGGDRL